MSDDVLLSFVHISDTHISPDPNYGKQETPHSTGEGARALVAQINALPFKPDFVLHTGDVAYDPDETAYHTAREILSQIRYPVYYVAGNHDKPEPLQRILLGRSEILAPFHYTFDMKGVQFIVLDSNGPAEVPRGNIIPEQLAWLDKLLSSMDDRPLVIAVHHNAVPVAVPWLDGFMRITNGEEFHNILLKARDRLRGVFFGHVHQNLTMFRDGIMYNSTLSSWGQFHAWPGLDDTVHDEGAEPGFSVVSITRANTYIRRYRFHI